MANVSAGYNWVSGETVTPAKLNSTAAPTVVVADNEVTTAKIADGNVTTSKIADASSTTTGVTNAKLRHSAALSVIGRSANSAGAPADIAAANDGEVFRRSGTSVGFGTVATAGIADNAVTTVKILNANVTPAKLSQPLTLRTAVPTTSGTSIDFTDIPSWVKRITVMLGGVSSTANSDLMIQLGDSGGFEISGYTSLAAVVNTSAGTDATVFTTGLGLTRGGTASVLYSAVCTISLLDPSTNTWVSSTNSVTSTLNAVFHGSGVKSLSGTLDRIRLTTVGGTGTFDAGTANIMYEG